jgi:hypothetical protein
MDSHWQMRRDRKHLGSAEDDTRDARATIRFDVTLAELLERGVRRECNTAITWLLRPEVDLRPDRPGGSELS